VSPNISKNQCVLLLRVTMKVPQSFEMAGNIQPASYPIRLDHYAAAL